MKSNYDDNALFEIERTLVETIARFNLNLVLNLTRKNIFCWRVCYRVCLRELKSCWQVTHKS